MPAVKRKYKEALSSESATDDQRQDEKLTSSHSSCSQGSMSNDRGKRKLKPKEMIIK